MRGELNTRSREIPRRKQSGIVFLLAAHHYFAAICWELDP